MKKKLYPIFLGMISALFMVSCESEEPFTGGNSGGGNAQDSLVNNWLYEDMFAPNYLWNVNNSPSLSLDPESFFNSLKNSNDTISKLVEESSLSNSVESYTLGFEYTINKYDDGSTYYMVAYVLPNSNAARAGLSRGCIITKIDDVDVNATTSKTQLKNAIAKAGAEGRNLKLTYIIPPASTERTADILPVIATEVNPILTSTSFDVADGILGYIVYNRFDQGKNNIYDKELVNKLQEFKNEGVNYLVLDLRYNGGGSLYPTGVLASAMVKNRVENDIFIKYVRDRSQSTIIKEIENIVMTDKTSSNTQIPRLGNQLKTIYIITGQTTSGTSNIFIYALQAYADNLKIVGESTIGSTNISIGSQTYNGWHLTLAMAYLANKNGQYDYTNGISPTPNYVVYEVPKKVNTKVKDLGDQEELVLYSIIGDIGGFSTRSISTDTQNSSIVIGSSLNSKPWAGKSISDL